MPTIVHLDIACDEPERARKFYESLLDWSMFQPPGMSDYFLFQTAGLDGLPGVGGGIGRRGEPSQRITTYFGVDSVDDYCARVEELGGKVVLPKTPIPGFGFLANCLDTEGNPFGLFQEENELASGQIR